MHGRSSRYSLAVDKLIKSWWTDESHINAKLSMQ
jgi:hypothetical protein